MAEEKFEVGDIVEYKNVGYEDKLDGSGEILRVFKDLSGKNSEYYTIAGVKSGAVTPGKLTLIKKCTTKHAVSVIDLARDAYWNELRQHAHGKILSLKNLSFHDLEQIFNKLIIPVIDVVRKADRESEARMAKS